MFLDWISPLVGLMGELTGRDAGFAVLEEHYGQAHSALKAKEIRMRYANSTNGQYFFNVENEQTSRVKRILRDAGIPFKQ